MNLFKSIYFRLQRTRNFRALKFLNNPGMMGYQERINLYQTCKSELKGNGVAIEFGAFLGASTSAIQAGLRANEKTKKIDLHVVDCFRSGVDTEFSLITRNIAAQAGQDSLLYENDGWLCFEKIFFANVNHEDTGLYVHRTLLDEFKWQPQPVEFLHLDLPKDWTLAYPIAQLIFPDLVVGAKVLFQDFGYQWSAELIAITGYLISKNLIKPYRVTDTTLSVEVINKISHVEIELLNEAIQHPDQVIELIDVARTATKKISKYVDISLLIAKSQYQYINKTPNEAFKTISELLDNKLFNRESQERLSDIFQNNFSFEKSYITEKV